MFTFPNKLDILWARNLIRGGRFSKFRPRY